MRDAIGGVVNIQLILVFIAVVSGYLAFSVSYTKAVHVKDFIIDKIEQYGEAPTENETVRTEVEKYMNNIGYHGVANANVDASKYCDEFSTDKEGFKPLAGDTTDYVICKMEGGSIGGNNVGEEPTKRNYYGVVTYITIDIPIVKNIMTSFQFFKISGKTRLIEEH